MQNRSISFGNEILVVVKSNFYTLPIDDGFENFHPNLKDLAMHLVSHNYQSSLSI